MDEPKLETVPPEARAFHEKGVVALERSNFDYAMDMFAAALEIEPRLLQSRRLLRIAEARRRNAVPPGPFAAIRGLGGLLRVAAKRKRAPLEALREAEALMRLDVFNPRFAKALCGAAVAAQMPEVAVQTLEILTEHRPDELAMLEPLADLYRDSRQPAREYGCRMQIARLKPNDADAQRKLKDAAARTAMDKAGWESAESFRDVMRKD